MFESEDLLSIEAPAICIKEENFSEYLEVEPPVELSEETNARKRSSKAAESMFCALCLRQCSSSLIVRFPSDSNVLERLQQKLQDAVGLWLALEHCEICRTCWKMVELVADFKECCLKAANWFEQYPYGVQGTSAEGSAATDYWLSSKTLDILKRTQKAIRKHIDSMEQRPEETEEDEEKMASTAIGISKRKDREMKVAESDVTDDDSSEESNDLSFNEALDESNDSEPEQKMATKPKNVRKGGRKAAFVDTPVENDKYKANIYNCEKCGRNFDGYQALLAHSSHCGGKNENREYFTCSLCSATFTESFALGYHMNKHKGIKPFKCRKNCGQTFYSNFVRIKHERHSCGQEARVCPICGVSLKNESSLATHIKVVHGTEEPRYACDICGQKFRLSSMLQRHKRVHSDERKYPCKMCDKAFKSPYAAKVHMRIHTNEKPYACHLCQQAFTYKISLKTHIERHH